MDKNAYRVMESMTPNQEVINTRLESLELESDRYGKWRIAFFAAVAFILINGGVSITTSVMRSSRESSTCRDTVKMTNEAVNAATLTCDHPSHHGKLDDKYRTVVLSCTCH